LTVWTVGHGTLPEADLVRLLQAAEMGHVVDVRSYPGSRRNPHYGRDQLERWLPAAGFGYSWDGRLGGRRRPDPASPNLALRHEAFRAYADHMRTDEFASGLEDLVEVAATAPVAVMCSEGLWWHCHRRLLADALVLLHSVDVVHLFHDGRRTAHPPTLEARVVGRQLVYDLGVTPPLG
jgi:uncharacterized protein (DUF488 family)